MNETTLRPGTSARMPKLGFGVYQLRGEECARACLAALESGYRHLDSAQLYGNEEDVGRALHQYLQQTNTCREDIFVTTKIGRHGDSEEATYRSALRSVKRITGENGYVDLFLVHRPIERRREVWLALERLLAEGRTRYIGVSNFRIEHIEEMKGYARVWPPAVNQIETTERAQVLFYTDSRHRVPLATPLAAMIRVPLSWHRSSTHPLFPDERYSAIRRVFESSSSHPSKRYFCGFCGTPLSYWTELPHTEADYIHLTLASLCGQDLRDLEDLGLIPEQEETEQQPAVPTTVTVVGRETRGVPWFDNMIEGSRLGNLRRNQVVDHSSRDGGNIRVEWEIVEWTDADDGNDLASETEDVDMTTGNLGNGKRKLGERDDADAAVEGMQ
ncbi:hypothetical protein CkaCkLH20_10821 [Colletotrichum karsti]|uniref:NADP-dependent oxidoreductase domain-containing protein n=1 Tax=Colletotrichum karsti TaxID=1095194 RepID=A0A9P6HVM8_9PEZI|nr:uncharacterized protein CkaCkLH20_10821 [Colletotrichum karsti]KAF9871623.1 hypothetical protein CkaCkLH20_10821 [Colletotrichum karsti]